MTTTTKADVAAANSEGLLIIISGPSAVGKDTILDRVLAQPDKLINPAVRCVTATTRQPRQGELDGINYHFLSPSQFQQMIEDDGFLEHADNYGNWYGTPRSWVHSQRRSGKDVVLNIDVKGALSVKKKAEDAIMIFLSPPSLAELERRIRARNTESEVQIERRMITARTEMAYLPHYDYCVVNNDVDLAVVDLQSIFRSEHCRVRKSG